MKDLRIFDYIRYDIEMSLAVDHIKMDLETLTIIDNIVKRCFVDKGDKVQL